jgi:hypothetical protein
MGLLSFDCPLKMEFAVGFQNFAGFRYSFVIIQPENEAVGLLHRVRGRRLLEYEIGGRPHAPASRLP